MKNPQKDLSIKYTFKDQEIIQKIKVKDILAPDYSYESVVETLSGFVVSANASRDHGDRNILDLESISIGQNTVKIPSNAAMTAVSELEGQISCYSWHVNNNNVAFQEKLTAAQGKLKELLQQPLEKQYELMENGKSLLACQLQSLIEQEAPYIFEAKEDGVKNIGECLEIINEPAVKAQITIGQKSDHETVKGSLNEIQSALTHSINVMKEINVLDKDIADSSKATDDTNDNTNLDAIMELLDSAQEDIIGYLENSSDNTTVSEIDSENSANENVSYSGWWGSFMQYAAEGIEQWVDLIGQKVVYNTLYSSDCDESS